MVGREDAYSVLNVDRAQKLPGLIDTKGMADFDSQILDLRQVIKLIYDYKFV